MLTAVFTQCPAGRRGGSWRAVKGQRSDIPGVLAAGCPDVVFIALFNPFNQYGPAAPAPATPRPLSGSAGNQLPRVVYQRWWSVL